MIAPVRAQSVLFFMPYGAWKVHNQLDGLVAAVAKSRNLAVHLITCDGLYDPCAITRGARNCTYCRETAELTLTTFDLSGRPLGSLILQSNVAEADAWVAGLPENHLVEARFRDLPIGEWAVSTVMTHFRISLAEQLADPRILPIHRRFLRDTLLTFLTLDRVLSDERIDAVFLFNARFYPYRAAFEAAKRRGLRVLVHERGRIADSFSFFDDETCLSSRPMRRLAKAWSNIPLDAAAIGRLEGHFSGKLVGQSSHWPSFYETVREADIYAVLDIPRNARLVGLFTTSSDEIAHFENYSNVTRQFELIDNIARALAGSDFVLVVRHHPAIGGMSAGGVEVSGFEQAYRQALGRRANMRILMPSDDVSSYALFPHLTAAIAPFSSIAMETIAYGIPTLVSEQSDAAFSGRFVLCDWSFETTKAAVDRLLSPQAWLRADDLRAFYRLCYAVLFRFSVSFKAIGIEHYFEPRLRLDLAEAVTLGRDPALDRVYAYLRDGTPVHTNPLDSDENGSAAAEDAFIVAQLRLFEERRRQRDCPSEAQPQPDPRSRFIALIDEDVEGPWSPNSWSILPHARNIAIHSFGAKSQSFSRPLQTLPFPQQWRLAISFERWRRQLRAALRQCADGYVLVTSKRFQFHDTSVAVILQAVGAAAAANQPVIALSGWIRDPSLLEPVPMNFDRADLKAWRALCDHGSNPLRIQDILAAFLVRRDWLLACLDARTSAETLAASIINEAAKTPKGIAVALPVFLLH